MFDLLKQPYPTSDGLVPQARKAALIGLFVGIFLVVFQPFGLNLWQTDYKAVKILGFGAVTFLVTSVNFIIWGRLFSRRPDDESWTVGREIISVISNILLIAIANRFYLEAFLQSEGRSGLDWLGMILVTFLISIFPVTALIVLNYIRQLKKYSQAAASLPLPIHPTTSQENGMLPEEFKGVANTPVILLAENEKDKLELLSRDILFIESSDNYCTVVYLKNDRPIKPLIRSSLSRLEKQIAQPYIVRCHRSYVVNLDRVERVTGNAQGYKLHLMEGQFQIPVARQYNETLIAELKAL